MDMTIDIIKNKIMDTDMNISKFAVLITNLKVHFPLYVKIYFSNWPKYLQNKH